MTIEEVRAIFALPVWQVIDNQTGRTIGKSTTRKRAGGKVDRLDLENGAYRYSVKQVQP